MEIKVLFFGYLAERLGCTETTVSAPSLSAAQAELDGRYPGLSGMACLWAVNQEVQRGDAPLTDGDEIAVMPPFAGG